MNESRDYITKINKIAFDPDRFGRIHPVIWFDTIIHQHRSYTNTHLHHDQLLLDHGYHPGDIITIRFIGPYPKLGAVITPSPKRYEPDDFNTQYCHHCQQSLTVKSGQVYCTNSHCPRIVFSRLSYAGQHNVLDLPIDHALLDYMVWGQQLVNDLPSLLYMDKSTIPKMWYDDDEIDMIQTQLTKRTQQLFGIDCDQTIQRLVQEKTIDALSIPGLCPSNRRLLCDQLQRGHWGWEQLAEILLDPVTLHYYGISKLDARRITQHVTERIPELDSLTRAF